MLPCKCGWVGGWYYCSTDGRKTLLGVGLNFPRVLESDSWGASQGLPPEKSYSFTKSWFVFVSPEEVRTTGNSARGLGVV